MRCTAILMTILLAGTFMILVGNSPMNTVAEPDQADVVVLNSNSYLKKESYASVEGIKQDTINEYTGKFLHVIGEVKNDGNGNAKVSSVTITYYDSAGGALESNTTMPVSPAGVILKQGEKWPFKAILLDEEISNIVTDYEVDIQAEATEEEPYRDLDIINHAYHSLYVRGEILNTGKEAVRDIRVFVGYYNDSGGLEEAEEIPYQVIGPLTLFKTSTFGEILPQPLLPGERAPFKIRGHFAYQDNYTLYVDCEITDEDYYTDFSILDPEIEETLDDRYQVTGKVQNTGSKTAKHVKVQVTFYDTQGKVVDFDSEPADPEELEPDDTGSFEVYGSVADGTEITDYRVQVLCSVTEPSSTDVMGMMICCGIMLAIVIIIAVIVIFSKFKKKIR